MIPDYPAAQSWPPADCGIAERYYREWSAWYSGDPEQLQSVYGGARYDVDATTSTQRASGGIRGFIQRMWWGRPASASQATTHLHVPIGSDVSTLSADLLYAQMPQFEIPGSGKNGERSTGEAELQAMLDDLVFDSGMPYVLPESAEIGSAYGGRYIGTRVDVSVSPDAPMVYTYAPDCAVPEFRYGRLTAVTFWRIVRGVRTGKIMRHLERHEVVDGRAMIYHALYAGTESELGMRVPLTESTETEPFAAKVGEDGGIWAGCSVLDVAYVPNMRPHRLIKGSALGRSDYAGAESVMDALDETYSSWQRDIRLGKGRILVPSGYLESLGAGKGAVFDIEREAFQTLNVLAPGGGTYVKPEVVQFAIRTADHMAACAQHVRTIVRSAGLSADAFGEEVDGGAATAKEIGRRGERTAATRAKKIQYETYALRQILFAMQEQAKNLIQGQFADITPLVPEIEFPDASAPDPQTFATTLKMLSDAKAASTYTLVKMQHPEWGEDMINEEVDRINAPAGNPDQFDMAGFLGAGGAGGGAPAGMDEQVATAAKEAGQ